MYCFCWVGEGDWCLEVLVLRCSVFLLGGIVAVVMLLERQIVFFLWWMVEIENLLL